MQYGDKAFKHITTCSTDTLKKYNKCKYKEL